MSAATRSSAPPQSVDLSDRIEDALLAKAFLYEHPAEYAEGVRRAMDAVREFGDLSEDEAALLLRIVDLIHEMGSGTVTLKLHEGRVTQLEAAERFRMGEEARVTTR